MHIPQTLNRLRLVYICVWVYICIERERERYCGYIFYWHY